jgi:hypothetical protein
LNTFIDTFRDLIIIALILMGASVAIASVGLIALARSIRRLRIPPDADFFTTMRYIPLTLVIVLDLLDFGLDIFSAPIIWIALDRMGLYNLRNKATIEALVPFTNVIPTFTASWFAARLLNLGEPPWPYEQSYWAERPARPLPRRPPRIIDMDDRRRR